MLHNRACVFIALVAAGLLYRLPPLAAEQKVLRLAKVSKLTNTLAQAKTMSDKGQWKQAIDICDNLVKNNSPQAKSAQLLKSQCLEYDGNVKGSLACYRTLLKEYPRSGDVEEIKMQVMRLSALELLEPEGLVELEAFIRDNPRSPHLRRARWWQAGIAYTKRDWASAKTMFTTFLAAYPMAPEAERARECTLDCISKLSEMEAFDKKRGAAIAAAQQAAQTREAPRETLLLLKAGQAAAQKSKMSAAIASYEAVRKFGSSPDYEQALLELGGLYMQERRPNDAFAVLEDALNKGTNVAWRDDCLLVKGRFLLEEKGLDKQSESVFRELLTRHPESPLKYEAFKLLAVSLLLQERTLEAKVVIQEARNNRPPGPTHPWDELDRLSNVCDGDKSLWPDRAKLRTDATEMRELRRADLLFAICDYEKAVRVYRRVAESSKELETAARSWLQAGRCWNQMRRFEKALDCYERFLKSPFDISEYADDALIRAGVIHVGPLGESRKGKELYERILIRYPMGDYAELAELYLCTLAYWEKDWATALSKHEAYLRRFPESQNAWFLKRERMPVIRAALAKKKAG